MQDQHDATLGHDKRNSKQKLNKIVQSLSCNCEEMAYAVMLPSNKQQVTRGKHEATSTQLHPEDSTAWPYPALQKRMEYAPCSLFFKVQPD